MKPIKAFPRAAARAIRFVLCDIDDTLTTGGRLMARAFTALERLQADGLVVVPVTGRPAGWCDHIARQWPVDGVVGENGALYFRYDAAERRMDRRFWHDAATRRGHRAALDRLAERIPTEVPGAAVAADQRYRESDLAIDFCEDTGPLDHAAVAQIVRLFHEAGATAKVSSIHVNGWFGSNDKGTMSTIFLKEIFGYDLAVDPYQCLFVGDSPNDCPMFAAAGHAIGVANVARYANELSSPPDWIAEQDGGAGFAEIARRLLELRGSA